MSISLELVNMINKLENRIKKIKWISNNVLYFDDNSDYECALWDVLAVANDWTDEERENAKLKYIDEE